MATMTPTIADEREDAVNGVFQLAGLGCIMFGQYSDAGAISLHCPPIAHEIAELAEKNEQVAKGVDVLLQVGPYAGLVAAIMPLVLQLMANHKVVDADKMPGANVVKPEVLEAQVKTSMAKQAMMAMQAQREAEEELAEMQKAMAAAQNGSDPSDD
jgi:hypothetical protein